MDRAKRACGLGGKYRHHDPADVSASGYSPVWRHNNFNFTVLLLGRGPQQAQQFFTAHQYDKAVMLGRSIGRMKPVTRRESENLAASRRDPNRMLKLR